MKPPYEISLGILQQIIFISEKIGEINAKYLNKQAPQQRKLNKIKTIHSSLKIEGNTLIEEHIPAIIESKKVNGPKKEILEVVNAIAAYDNLLNYKSFSEKNFLSAHKLLMKNLVGNAGIYRNQGVGIIKGSKVKHVAPPFKNVPFLMKGLFN